MKKKEILISFFLVCAIMCFVTLNFTRSYSYGYHVEVSGTKAGSRVLKYYDENNKEISVEKAISSYGATKYQEFPNGSTSIYFYNGKEISASKYKTGYAAEQADLRAKQYGSAGIRVSTTDNFKKAWDNIFLNYKTGEFAFIWSEYDNIDFDAVDKYVLQKYGVTNPSQNYYKFDVKGPQEPIRFSLELKKYKNQGIFRFTNIYTRYTGDEKKKADNFIQNMINNNILPSKSAPDYQKIKATYQLLVRSKKGGNPDTNDALSSYTSMSDLLLENRSDCVGLSVTFAYIMQNYYGIETYIVDNASVNVADKSFQSTHTYNLVKLGNKFYKIDLEGSMTLGVMDKAALKPSTSLNLATSNYVPTSTENSYNILWNDSVISKYITQAKNLNVSTTSKSVLTTAKTTAPKTNSNSGTNGTTRNTDYTTTTSEYTGKGGSGIIIHTGEPTTSLSTSSTTPTIHRSSSHTTTTAKIEEKEDKTTFNLIMIGIIIFIIVGYIIYKVVSSKNKTSSMSADAQAILNRDIIRTEEDDNNLNNANNNIAMNNMGVPINQNNMNNAGTPVNQNNNPLNAMNNMQQQEMNNNIPNQQIVQNNQMNPNIAPNTVNNPNQINNQNNNGGNINQ